MSTCFIPRRSLLGSSLVLACLASGLGAVQAQTLQTSELATWDCAGATCPWGDYLTGEALVWPASSHPISTRLGYTVSAGVYLPAVAANGLVLTIQAGHATAFAGLPDAPAHRVLHTFTAGEPFVVAGVAEGEVLSVQSGSTFAIEVASAPPQEPEAEPQAASSSATATWSCTGVPCPWGMQLSGDAIVWPASTAPLSHRLGYTVSAGIYLPATAGNGLTLTLTSGAALVLAGEPNAPSHRLLRSLNAWEPYTVTGLAAGEVLSVQHEQPFTFVLDFGAPAPAPPPEPDPEPDPQPEPEPQPEPAPQPEPPIESPVAPAGSTSSATATWTCVGSPCPWGGVLSGEAIVWPAASEPLETRLGYAVSAGIYLPGAVANGLTVSVVTGAALVLAGHPDDPSHRLLASLAAGGSYAISGLAADQVLSVQSESRFTLAVTASTPAEPDEGVFTGQTAWWRCNTPGCTDPDWQGAVIDWPSWAAYETNARSGSNSRIVYSPDGTLLYPYMGPWAHGCEVSVVHGQVLIIEWQRGTDVWRGTLLNPGDRYTIQLGGSEDGAMIETPDTVTPFAVSLSNCTPQPVPR